MAPKSSGLNEIFEFFLLNMTSFLKRAILIKNQWKCMHPCGQWQWSCDWSCHCQTHWQCNCDDSKFSSQDKK